MSRGYARAYGTQQIQSLGYSTICRHGPPSSVSMSLIPFVGVSSVPFADVSLVPFVGYMNSRLAEPLEGRGWLTRRDLSHLAQQILDPMGPIEGEHTS